MTVPNYMQTLRRAIRELEEREKSPPLNSFNSFISYPLPSEDREDKERISRTDQEKRIIALRGGAYEKNELNEISHPRPSSASRLSDSAPRAQTYEKNELNEKRVALPFTRVLDALERRCPDYVEAERWRQCVEDARRFLASWGDQALALGWTSTELFGLHKPPAKPHPSYSSRLSRYDCTGLLWLLQGRRVVALSGDTAAIQNPSTGNVLTYRKARKPAYGPLGDSLDDFTA